MPVTDDRSADRSGLDIFILTEFIDRSEGDYGLAREVASIFRTCAPGYIGSLRNAVTAGDAYAAQQSAHKLKGAAANLALPLLEDSACMIESLAKRGHLEKVELLLPELDQRLAEALETLQKVLISPQGG
jgi:HPt (histidine-containing phosphotransfer) domain-containing protein